MNEFDEVQESQEEETKSKRGRGRSVAGMTAKAADNMRTDIDARIKFKRDAPRMQSADLELNLSVPAGTIPDGYVGQWIVDSGKGEIDTALAAWWGHVCDAQGVNISRQTGSRKIYLMAIEESLKKEIDDLQLRRYRDSIGENDNASLGVEGVEHYKPNGAANNIKVTSDPFAM
jgi:hypothetical protein